MIYVSMDFALVTYRQFPRFFKHSFSVLILTAYLFQVVSNTYLSCKKFLLIPIEIIIIIIKLTLQEVQITKTRYTMWNNKNQHISKCFWGFYISSIAIGQPKISFISYVTIKRSVSLMRHKKRFLMDCGSRLCLLKLVHD